MDDVKIDLTGGNEPSEFNINWLIVIVILIVILYLYNKQNFKVISRPLIKSKLPYDGGASLRIGSVDSATNRGGFTSSGFDVMP